MAIAVVFVGLSRFNSVTKPNHLELLNLLDKKYGVTVYNFYRETDNPDCPFHESGKVQVFDFLTSRDKVKEDIMLKIRSDVFFTKTSIDIVCREIDQIIEGNNDVAYMGLDFLLGYDKEYQRDNARDVKKITDFVIAARCNSVEETEKVIHILANHVKDKSGNKTFFNLLKPESRAVKVSCQMYLVRKSYKILDNWEIYWDWCQQYKKSEIAQEWVKNNKEIINSF